MSNFFVKLLILFKAISACFCCLFASMFAFLDLANVIWFERRIRSVIFSLVEGLAVFAKSSNFLMVPSLRKIGLTSTLDRIASFMSFLIVSTFF